MKFSLKNQNFSSLYPKTGALRSKIAHWRDEFHRTKGEEWANGLSHLAGGIFGIVALVLLCVWASRTGRAAAVAGSAIFGATIVILYYSSAIYHFIRNHRLKSIFQIFDHISIYLLIAGTYTPISLLVLQGKTGCTVLILTWCLAVFGILLETVFRRYQWLSLFIYLGMGWQVALFFPTLIHTISTPALWLIIAGGLSYTVGVIFFVMDRVPYMHTIWHFFVLGGTVCHWVSINFFVLITP